jgi:putative tryptophan/tyrosine transport system substrate-binding protein
VTSYAMQRREFIALVGGAAAAWPLVAHAQQSAMPVVGFLGPESPALFADRLPAFLQALSEGGFVEGRNIAIEYRWAEGQNDRLPPLVADLVRRQVAVIVAPGSTPAVFAAKAVTTTIPIVFFVGSDPVRGGLVASLNRPGGNVTGVTTLNVEVVPKRLEFLHQLVPRATSFALLLNPTNPAAEAEARDLQAAARKLGLQLHVMHASSERDFDSVFTALAKQRIEALVIGTDALFNTRGTQLALLTSRHAMPTIHAWRAFAETGGLISFGSSISGGYRQVGAYTSRILKGEKPADLPVEQVTKIELILNLKTAKALGLDVPPALLIRADEVIE